MKKLQQALSATSARGLSVEAPEGFEDLGTGHTIRGSERDVQGANTQNRGSN